MNSDLNPLLPEDGTPVPNPRRLFVFEPGWRVGLKIGSVREFCYMMTPGQDYYHRFYDGEIFVHRGEERLCLACAERRGLLAYEPKGLRENVLELEFEVNDSGDGIDFKTPDPTD